MESAEVIYWVLVALATALGLALVAGGLTILAYDALVRLSARRAEAAQARLLLRAELDEPPPRPDEIFIASHDVLLGQPPAFSVRRPGEP